MKTAAILHVAGEECEGQDHDSIETSMKKTYQTYDKLMSSKDNSKLMTIIRKALEQESKFKSDIVLGSLSAIDSSRMLEYTLRVSLYTLAQFRKDAPTDGCDSYHILSSEVLSDSLPLEKVNG